VSEWRGTGTHVMRTYAEGLYASAREATGWDLWAAPRPRDAVEIVATGPECLPFSRELCDAAAVAWVLIALAKRAAAWARDVDARLARCYRAATLAFDAHRERGPQGGNTAAYARKRDALEDAVSAADVALLRGYP